MQALLKLKEKKKKITLKWKHFPIANGPKEIMVSKDFG